MKAIKFKGTAVFSIEAESFEDAMELSTDESFLKGLIASDEVEITKVKCTGVEELDQENYELTCTLEGSMDEGVDLKKFGIEKIK